jgi:hypothetical protein
MIIGDLHFVGTSFKPPETNAILIVNSNAVLATAIAVPTL